jgi:hypothetical protein
MVGDPASDDAMQIEGTVRECSFRGSYYRLEISHSAGIDLVFDLISHAATLPQPGELVTLALCPEAISLWLE